MVKLTIDQKR